MSPCDTRESNLLDYNGTANTELLSPAQTRGVIVLENAFVIPSACDICRMYVFLKKSEPSWHWNSIIPQPVICFQGEVTFNAFILILSLITKTCHRVGKECLQRLFSMIYYFLMQSNCSETVWIMHCAWWAAPQSFHFDGGKKRKATHDINRDVMLLDLTILLQFIFPRLYRWLPKKEMNRINTNVPYKQTGKSGQHTWLCGLGLLLQLKTSVITSLLPGYKLHSLQLKWIKWFFILFFCQIIQQLLFQKHILFCFVFFWFLFPYSLLHDEFHLRTDVFQVLSPHLSRR